jgi:hypothetical protein
LEWFGRWFLARGRGSSKCLCRFAWVFRRLDSRRRRLIRQAAVDLFAGVILAGDVFNQGEEAFKLRQLPLLGLQLVLEIPLRAPQFAPASTSWRALVQLLAHARA